MFKDVREKLKKQQETLNKIELLKIKTEALTF